MKPEILLVEDDAFVLDVVRRIIEENGMHVEAFSNPEEALAAYGRDSHGFDLVLSDVVMPGISGVEMYELMIRANPDQAFLFMSAYPDYEDDLKALVEKRLPVIRKPFKGAELVDEIRHLLRSGTDSGILLPEAGSGI